MSGSPLFNERKKGGKGGKSQSLSREWPGETSQKGKTISSKPGDGEGEAPLDDGASGIRIEKKKTNFTYQIFIRRKEKKKKKTG